MSDEATQEPSPAPEQPKVRRTLIPEGATVTINGRTFRLEMRTVVSGTKEDIEALKLKELD